MIDKFFSIKKVSSRIIIKFFCIKFSFKIRSIDSAGKNNIIDIDKNIKAVVKISGNNNTLIIKSLTSPPHLKFNLKNVCLI